MRNDGILRLRDDKVPRLLALCGPSGAGKTTLEASLCKAMPTRYNKLQQCTTRGMRPGESQGNPYLFLSEAYFSRLRAAGMLIGVVTGRAGFGSKYGTFPDLDPGRINTAILNREGLEDVLRLRDSGELAVFVLLVDASDEVLSTSPDKVRQGRDESFIRAERSSFDGLADYVSVIESERQHRDPVTLHEELTELFPWFFEIFREGEPAADR